MQIIDFRLRPAIPAFVDHLRWRLKRHPPNEASPVHAALARALDPDALITEMDRLGVRLGVFTGRDWYGEDADWPLTNEAIAETAANYTERFIGYGGVDPRRPDPRTVVRTAVEDLGLRGICIDGFALASNPADEAFAPIYESCSEFGVPVVITLGALPGIPSPMDASHPRHVDEVALAYPDLKIVLSHAAWPYTGELLGVVFRHPNLWMENSFYHFAPGVPSVMVDAINHWVTDKVLFATAFPSAPLEETITRLEALPFTETARRHMFHDNAAALLGLNDGEHIG